MHPTAVETAPPDALHDVVERRLLLRVLVELGDGAVERPTSPARALAVPTATAAPTITLVGLPFFCLPRAVELTVAVLPAEVTLDPGVDAILAVVLRVGELALIAVVAAALALGPGVEP